MFMFATNFSDITLKFRIVNKSYIQPFIKTFRLSAISPGTFILYKGKAVPLPAWSGPEGSRKLRFSDFMTTAQDGGKVVSLTHRPPLPPGNTPVTHFC